ncbi:MAG: Asp-tRNA(Asn)/Glu-tRNA(Gln) amidotransferase GatCAB subunit B, partial [Candidatus Latescibacterota bacterium]
QLEVTERLMEAAAEALPELPDTRQDRFVRDYKISREDAALLSSIRELADYFESVAEAAGDARSACNWILGEVLRELNRSKQTIDEFGMAPKNLADLICTATEGRINMPTAKRVFRMMLVDGRRCDEIIREGHLEQISNQETLQKIIASVLAAHAVEVGKYLSGKEQLLTFFVGQVMEQTAGKADPKRAVAILKAELERRR